MIDWLSIVVPFEHPRLFAGAITSIDTDGTVEWESPKRYQHRRSYETTVFLKSQGSVQGDPGLATHLYIDGNLSKMLLGHNVDGPDCFATLVTTAFKLICRQLEIPFTVFDLYRVSKGVFQIKRLDLTYYLSAGTSDADTDALLIALGETGGTKLRKAYTDKGSVYFQQGSRRWSAVFYNKAKELKKHKPPRMDHVTRWLFAESPKRLQSDYEPHQYGNLIKACTGMVRVEFRLLSLELNDQEIENGQKWVSAFGTDPELDPATIWGNMMRKLRFSGNVRINGDALNDLPGSVRGTYELWRSGVAVRELLTRATFYRHKRILREHGVNIDEPMRDAANQSVVVPIIRYVEARPVAPNVEVYSGLLARAV